MNDLTKNPIAIHPDIWIDLIDSNTLFGRDITEGYVALLYKPEKKGIDDEVVVVVRDTEYGQWSEEDLYLVASKLPALFWRPRYEYMGDLINVTKRVRPWSIEMTLVRAKDLVATEYPKAVVYRVTKYSKVGY